MRTIVMLAVLVLALALSGCAAKTVAAPALAAPALAAPAFPIGKLTLQGNPQRSLQFNQDGTFAALDGNYSMVDGKYTIQGDTYTEISDSQGCPNPKHYKFTIKGNSLVFHPVEDPKTDPCDGGRTSDFGETSTWVISSPANAAGASAPLIHQGLADVRRIDSAQSAGR